MCEVGPKMRRGRFKSRSKTRKLYFPWNATRGMGCLEWDDAHHC
ncbi:hypothetical protein C5167_024805 [Papaver somniferum]|uniref:Uncharacterized protein n=1 Tax=Papaver somniferum TaxID=3469 RepID=A0A4Y7JQR0_PAPSO|nr:hypothetical protein C5167_024805 [Papaver somniferum]